MEQVLSAEMVKIKDSDKKYHLNKSYLASPLVFGSCRLYQIGRLYCTENTVVSKHAHINWFELTIVTEGKGTVYTDDVGIPVRRGDIYLSFPCDFHGIVSDPGDPLKYDFFAFSTDQPEWAADLEQIVQTHRAADRRLLRDDTVSSLIAGAIAEVDHNERYAPALLEAIFTQVIVRLIRGFLDQNPGGSHGAVTDSQALCYRLMNYIDTHIYTMTGLQELSELTNYNYSYLSALFRRVTGSTLAEYHRNRRLEAAKLLIAENELSITHIADLLNYSSIYTFSRAFKDQYGISPEQYRKEQTVLGKNLDK